jgi:Polyketide cyclase / dehydrase and lipid transport
MGDRTTSSISIAADRPEVMAVIADFAAYPQWAAAVRSAEVIHRDPEGRPSQVRFSLDAGMIKDSYVLGYQWDGDASVRWDLAQPGTVVSAMTGGYFLAGQPAGTDVTYELSVDVRVPLLGMLKRRAEKMIIDTALKGLKSRVEGLHTQAAGTGSGQQQNQDKEEGAT